MIKINFTMQRRWYESPRGSDSSSSKIKKTSWWILMIAKETNWTKRVKEWAINGIDYFYSTPSQYLFIFNTLNLQSCAFIFLVENKTETNNWEYLMQVKNKLCSLKYVKTSKYWKKKPKQNNFYVISLKCFVVCNDKIIIKHTNSFPILFAQKWFVIVGFFPNFNATICILFFFSYSVLIVNVERGPEYGN